MKKGFRKIKDFLFAHRVWSLLILLALATLGWGAWKVFGQTESLTTVVFETAKRENLTAILNGSGQVSAARELDLTSKVSGDLVYLNARTGQEVKAGALVAQIDAATAAFELENARLAYEETATIDADELRLAQTAFDEATEGVADAYVSARAGLTSAATGLTDILTDLNDQLDNFLSRSNQFNLSQTEQDRLDQAETAYYRANNAFKSINKRFRLITQNTSNEEISVLLTDCHAAAVTAAQAAKQVQDAVIYFQDSGNSNSADEAYESIVATVTDSNALVSSLANNKNSLLAAERTLIEAQVDLAELKDGPDPLALRQDQLTLRQKQETYADYFIRAPFDGIIASVDVQKGESLSSGAAIATIITKQKVAEISLNEIDAAKIKPGQKASLTFDALEGLTLPGEVAEIDLVGTVSQGVVSYDVKIVFDDAASQIKSGMSVSADIVIAAKTGVIAVPTSAVKTRGGKKFISVAGADGATESREVTTGLATDDKVEIVSGLNEGERFATQTVNRAADSGAGGAPSGGSIMFGGGASAGLRSGGLPR